MIPVNASLPNREPAIKVPEAMFHLDWSPVKTLLISCCLVGLAAGCAGVPTPMLKLIAATIDSFGPPSNQNKDAAAKLYADRLASLGDVEFGDIRIEPFKTEKHGIEFGLIPRECEDEDDEPAIELQPGNYMAFFDPWDGDYDT